MPGTSPWLWPLRMLGVAVVAALLAAGTVSIVTQFFVRETTTTQTFDEPVSRLVVGTDSGRIAVAQGAAGSPVSVTALTRAAFGEPSLSMRVRGEALVLDGRCDGRWVFGEQCTVEFDVTVPPGTTLALDSATGEIVVVGVDSDISADAAAGRLELRELTSDTVQARVATGELVLDFAEPPTTVRARVATGSLRVTVPADGTTYQVTATTSVGSPRVSVPTAPDASRTLDLSASVGEVVVSTAP